MSGNKTTNSQKLVYFARVKIWKASKERETGRGYAIKSFDISKKEWIQLGEVQFEVMKQDFGKGGFRRASKAPNDNILFQNKSLGTKKVL